LLFIHGLYIYYKVVVLKATTVVSLDSHINICNIYLIYIEIDGRDALIHI